ncbi:unnamed protein product [Fraxinus pennsylvanica]|uniref:CCHC-type domain-containing protein n=1 Tax=Fraxinus pennsylvanica TaxID=56036 RepID=A0AAD2AFN6_9LAMI|nr:unnamed protein product [Fraxinus pennsylvanica]
MDDTNTKQAYLESIHQPLGQETLRTMEMKGQPLNATSFGELHNWIMRTLKKLCNQNAFLKYINAAGRKLENACEKPYLQIKCSRSMKDCDCPGKKKFQKRRMKFSHREVSLNPFRRKKRFFRRKFSKKKENRCFICGKKCHFAKVCPYKKKDKILHQMFTTTKIDYGNDDLESLFSKQDEQSQETVFTLDYDSDGSLSDEIADTDKCYGMQVVNPIFLPIHVPMPEVKLLTGKYERTITVPALFDTGACCSILNPAILPDDMWKNYQQTFQVANGESFSTEIVSKPVTIQFFLELGIYHKLLGSSLLCKDLIIAWDIIKHTHNK